MRVRCGYFAVALIVGGLCCGGAFGAPLAPLPKGAWSETVSNVAGRLRVEKATIAENEHFELTLELFNRGDSSLAVRTYYPFDFTASLRDSAGNEVKPTSGRVDIFSCARWGVVPGRSYLGFPVSNESPIRDSGYSSSNLDVIRHIWKLAPGKYRISGTFTWSGEVNMGGTAGVERWKGKLDLPPIDVEVVGKK